jgi:hypothetical protein
MTAAAATLTEPARSAGAVDRRARLVEFLLVGGVTLVLFPLGWLLRRVVGADAAELAVGFIFFHGALVMNDPHFSVTYLLFYKDARRRALGEVFSPAQRARYVFAGFVVPTALAAWAVAAIATDSAHVMGLLIQLMFLLVGWHYVKQGFGVLTVLSARRGIRFSAVERRVLLVHCYAGWAYAWASPFDPGREVEEKGVVYTTLAQPYGLELAAGVVFAASALALLWVLAKKWQNERRLPYGPLGAFLISIWLWTVYSSVDPLMVYMIPALHSVQYLYFVGLLKRNEARVQEGPPLFGRPVKLRLALLAASALGLGWVLFHGAPAFLDGNLVLGSVGAPGGLGATPYFAAIFALLNIHHYFMDNVIWRRENPETRYLRA